MIRLLLLGLLLLPLVEIALFIIVGRAIGLLPTLALVIGAAILGGLLLRQQGLGVVSRLRANMRSGTMPGRTIFDAMLIGLAALFLVLPGFLSDIVALALLVPAVRGWIFSSLARRVTVVDTTANYRPHHSPEDGRLTRPTTIDLDNNDWRDGRP